MTSQISKRKKEGKKERNRTKSANFTSYISIFSDYQEQCGNKKGNVQEDPLLTWLRSFSSCSCSSCSRLVFAWSILLWIWAISWFTFSVTPARTRTTCSSCPLHTLNTQHTHATVLKLQPQTKWNFAQRFCTMHEITLDEILCHYQSPIQFPTLLIPTAAAHQCILFQTNSVLPWSRRNAAVPC